MTKDKNIKTVGMNSECRNMIIRNVKKNKRVRKFFFFHLSINENMTKPFTIYTLFFKNSDVLHSK